MWNATASKDGNDSDSDSARVAKKQENDGTHVKGCDSDDGDPACETHHHRHGGLRHHHQGQYGQYG